MDHRPSATAVLVMRGVAAVAAELPEIVPLQAAAMVREMLRRESGLSRAFVSLLRYRAFRAAAFGIQRLITPGIFLHFALRKRFIEDAVREAIADGYRQVVILGAGLDTLALRLHAEYRTVEFAEVDHPASQAAKHPLLPVDPEPNLRFLPLDLAVSDLRERLASYLRPEAKTVFIAEGLTMYLPESAVRQLFATLRTLAPEARLIFTAMELNAEGQPDFRRRAGLVHWWLAQRREPFRWGIRPEKMGDFLRAFGYGLRQTAGADRLREYLPPRETKRDLAEGEWIYVAD